MTEEEAFRPSNVRERDSEAADNLQILGKSFARQKSFWQEVLLSVVIGSVLGFGVFSFFYAVESLASLWYESDYLTCQGDSIDECLSSSAQIFDARQTRWLWQAPLFGLAIGILKILPLGKYSYPEKVHGFLRKVHDLHVDPRQAPTVILAAILSLAGGGSLGPEAALGWLGGSVGTLVGDYMSNSPIFCHTEDLSQVSAFQGMSSTLGALLPAPILGPYFLVELGISLKTDIIFKGNYMERLVTSVIGAGMAFLVFRLLGEMHVIRVPLTADRSTWHFKSIENAEPSTPYCLMFLNYYSGSTNSKGYSSVSNGIEASLSELLHNPHFEVPHFKNWWWVTSILVGMVSGFAGLICVVTMNIFKRIGKRIQSRMTERGRGWLGKLLLPVVCGAIVGMCGYYEPQSFGDGSSMIKGLVMGSIDGSGNSYKESQLVALIGMKLLAFGACQGFGYVGGQLFPVLFIGVVLGVLTCKIVPWMPFGVTLVTYALAVPAAFVPTPFFFIILGTSVVGLGEQLVTPVAIAIFTSFLTVSGLGVLQGGVKKSLRREYPDIFGEASMAEEEESYTDEEVQRSMQANLHQGFVRPNDEYGSDPSVAYSVKTGSRMSTASVQVARSAAEIYGPGSAVTQLLNDVLMD